MNDIIVNLKKNKRQVKLGIKLLNPLHLRAVRKGTKCNEITLDNLYSKMLLVMWVSMLEIEFDLLLYDPIFGLYLEKFLIDKNINNLSEINKWRVLVEFCFRKQYLNNNLKTSISVISLGDTSFHRYLNLLDILEKDIKPYVELRNRLAHGQWSIAFNDSDFEKNQKITQFVWTISKKDLMLLKSYIKNFPTLIRSLLLSKKTFESTYDKYVNRINLAKNDIDKRYAWLKSKR